MLDANDFFGNSRGAPLLSFKRSQFGGMVERPDYQKSARSSWGRTRDCGSAASRARLRRSQRPWSASGDFSKTFAANGQVIQIYDPFSTRANPSGSGYIRDVFPGNAIPATRWDPVAMNAMKYYPMPNSPGLPVTGQQNFYKSGSAPTDTDNFDIRVDHNLTNSQRIFGRYSHRLVKDVPAHFSPTT